MKLTKISVALFAILGLQCSYAQNTKDKNTSYPNDEIPYYMEEGVKMSLKNNTPLVITGIKDFANGATPAEMAKNWIIENAETLKLRNADNLEVYFERSGPAGHNIRFRQYFNGVPVFQSEVVVHISPNNEVTHVLNSFDPSVEGINTSPGISSSKALTLARKNIGSIGELNFSSEDLMIYNRETKALIYKVVLEPQDVLGSWEVLVNAHSGEIIRAANKACNHKGHEGESCQSAMPLPPPPPANGTGNVFDPDPLSVAQTQYAAPYNDGNDATNASLDAAMSNVTLLDINFDGTNYTLVGPYAENTDFENPWRGDFAQTSPDFNFNRNDNGFEAVNCYYHIDHSMRYINETLGSSCMPFQYSGGVQYDPHGLNGQDNSYYLGGSGRVAFGEGGVDDAEDADVVLHELGHGIHDWLTGGNLSQVNGLSEGCGDYWAVSYSRSLNQWTSGDAEYNWVFNWDGHNQFWNGRITNYSATYPGGLVGQIHTDGQIWGTTMMRIYDILGRTKVDAAFIEGLAMTGSSTSQQDAAIAVRQAAIDMGYSCADVDVFTVEFTATGYNMPALTPPSSDLIETLCAGESVVVNGTTYNQLNPSGTEVIPGATAACDSTVTINLSFLPAISSSISNQLCFGESIVVNGTTYNQSNPSGTEVMTAQNGCDSTVTIALTFTNALQTTLNGPICQGESVVVNGNTYDYNTPTGTEVMTSQSGCDSTITIDFTPIAPPTGSENGNLCFDESITVNGTIYDVNNPSGTEIILNGSQDGCDSTVTINLTFDAQISNAITNNSPTLSADQTGATYQWVDCDNGNAPINGETNQTFTATANGNYAVEITVNNCTQTSTCENVNNVGLESLELAGILVYPNPSTGLFIVEASDLSEKLQFNVLSVDGKLIRNNTQLNNTTTIDLRSESKGVYFLHINNSNETRVFKLVVE